MTIRSLITLAALAFAPVARSLAFEGPAPTQDVMFAGRQEMSPRPTDSPYAPRNIFKRAIAGAATCGWIYDSIASSSSLLTCNIGTCAIFTTGMRAQGCCLYNYQSCDFATRCYDYSEYRASSCTGSCLTNNLNLICSASSQQYCLTYTWSGSALARGYACDSVSTSSAVTVVTAATTGSLTTSVWLSTAPARALSSSTTRRIASGTTYTVRSTSTSTSSRTSYRYSSGIGAGAIAAVVVILVIWGCWYVAALIILICVCKRHRRFMANVDQQQANRGMTVVPLPAGAAGSNVVSPGGYQQPMQQHGVAGGYYEGAKGSPGTATTATYPDGISQSASSPGPYPAYPSGYSSGPIPTYQTPPPQAYPAPVPTSSPPAQPIAQPPAQPVAQAYQPPAGPPPSHQPPRPTSNVHELS